MSIEVKDPTGRVRIIDTCQKCGSREPLEEIYLEAEGYSYRAALCSTHAEEARVWMRELWSKTVHATQE